MNADPSRTASAVLRRLLSRLRPRTGLFQRLRLSLPRSAQPDKSIQALAAVGDDELCNLSESGLRLRREARRARSARRRIQPSYGAWLPASLAVLLSATQVVAEQVCSPALTIERTHLSEVERSTSERTWTAVISVDASRCAPQSSGEFQLAFSRLKETGPELQFRERLRWRPPEIAVKVAFWADEAVERAWIESVTPCPCAP